MTTPLNHFLLVFDHSRAELVDLKDFGTDAKNAMSEYARLERQHMGKADAIEIVLIGSDSLETVKVTHANYFDGTVAVCRSTSPASESLRATAPLAFSVCRHGDRQVPTRVLHGRSPAALRE